MATVTLAGLEELQAQVRGDVITPDDARYEDARKVYNAMIDKHPALVVSCRDVADVQAALAFGRANGLDIAVRGAGHNGAGLGTVDGGLVIDLSPMRWVARRSERTDGAGRRRLHDGRHRPRDARVRPRGPGRHHRRRPASASCSAAASAT